MAFACYHSDGRTTDVGAHAITKQPKDGGLASAIRSDWHPTGLCSQACSGDEYAPSLFFWKECRALDVINTLARGGVLVEQGSRHANTVHLPRPRMPDPFEIQVLPAHSAAYFDAELQLSRIGWRPGKPMGTRRPS